MRTFPLDEILSVTSERLVADRHISAVYELLGYMTGENLFTHQLGKANGPCAAALLNKYPELAKANEDASIAQLQTLINLTDKSRSSCAFACKMWVKWTIEMYGLKTEYEVEPLSAIAKATT